MDSLSMISAPTVPCDEARWGALTAERVHVLRDLQDLAVDFFAEVEAPLCKPAAGLTQNKKTAQETSRPRRAARSRGALVFPAGTSGSPERNAYRRAAKLKRAATVKASLIIATFMYILAASCPRARGHVSHRRREETPACSPEYIFI